MVSILISYITLKAIDLAVCWIYDRIFPIPAKPRFPYAPIGLRI